ncbi:MAG: hypothetical protein ABSF00_11920 [Candidatus Bathyarchaeia archaeon]
MVKLSGLRPEIRRFLNDPGPKSSNISSSTTIEGHARFALTEEPPEPKNVSFKKLSAFESWLSIASDACVLWVADRSE